MATKERETLLREKTAHVTRQLAAWAGREGILRAHEKLVVELRIQSVQGDGQTDACEQKPTNPVEILEMNTWDFFTPQRIRASGFLVERNLTILRRLWAKADYRRRHQRELSTIPDSSINKRSDITTVQALVGLGKLGLRRGGFKFGEQTITMIAKILADAGIDMPEYPA